MLNSETSMHTVVPNWECLGLISERSEDASRRLGVFYGERVESTHQLPLAN